MLKNKKIIKIPCQESGRPLITSTSEKPLDDINVGVRRQIT